jgi:hypothetical protein
MGRSARNLPHAAVLPTVTPDARRRLPHRTRDFLDVPRTLREDATRKRARLLSATSDFQIARLWRCPRVGAGRCR